ncbi:MAG TPA: rhomboid family intramembrane serine protease [Candidatus Limnocylindrales bacterium]|nr:rhomboid family intramembrane serine protease [Candidatus Limnocylindrales bacterium]
MTGPLSAEAAAHLLDQGAALIQAGDFEHALVTYQRVVGFDDAEVTAAALLGMAQARYRMDDEDAALRTWEAILELPETSATYHAWRNVAAARVRDGDLNGAIAAYREADRRAPAEDKREIANRLGWLAKETGNVRASRRYFARGRGAYLSVATYAILGITIAVSLAAAFASDGARIYDALEMNKPLLADGQIWRLITVTLLHGDAGAENFGFTLIHLGLNMYALYLVGPIVERLYGPGRLVAFYLVAAVGGSLGTFAFGDAPLGTGASGAIFGLFGVVFAATRLHLPLLDSQSRRMASQIGTLILINLVIGASQGFVDNAAHVGGLIAGALLAVAFMPGKVPTLRSMWQAGSDGQLAAGGFLSTPTARALALVILVVAMAVTAYLGVSRWADVPWPIR